MAAPSLPSLVSTLDLCPHQLSSGLLAEYACGQPLPLPQIPAPSPPALKPAQGLRAPVATWRALSWKGSGDAWQVAEMQAFAGTVWSW